MDGSRDKRRGPSGEDPLGPYTADERRRLAEALREGQALRCPCGGTLHREVLEARKDVAYVRRRTLLVCPQCRRSATFDVRAGAPP